MVRLLPECEGLVAGDSTELAMTAYSGGARRRFILPDAPIGAGQVIADAGRPRVVGTYGWIE